MFENYHEWSDDQIKEKYLEVLKLISERSAERAGTINCYTCEKCHRSEKYIYIDSGVTPFMNTCNFCGELAQSSFGRDIIPGIPATMEWFRPELEEILELKNSTNPAHHSQLEHYLNGGLESRKRFSGKNIVLVTGIAAGYTGRAEYLGNYGVGVYIASVSDITPITEPPEPVKIPEINIPPAPKSRKQKRKEERENKKNKKR